MPNRRLALLAALSAAALAAGCGSMMGMGHDSNMAMFSASLSGAQEVPAKASNGTGMAEVRYDKATGTLHYRVTYSGLSGPATAAHIHGPAAMGANAGVVVPFPNAASPIVGEAKLSAAQASDLMAGMYYVNVHTAANPGGEIRGQLTMKH